MAQYIDKDALVAEIRSRLLPAVVPHGTHYDDWDRGADSERLNILSFINTLEVKENDLLTEEKIEKELAESYINLFDKKFGDKLPNLKGKHLAEFKYFINTCEQIFHLKYFDYHATQGKLFEKLALLWAAWGKEHLSLEVKEVDLGKELVAYHNENLVQCNDGTLLSEETGEELTLYDYESIAKHFFELGLKAQQNINIDITNIDKVIEKNGVDPNSKEAKVFKESYYIALEKLKAQKGE